MDTFVPSSVGTVGMTLFPGIFPAPSWQPCTALACGWALAGDRHTMTTSGWLTGAAAVKPFARFSVFRGCPLYHTRWHLWGAVIRRAAQWVPEGAVMRVSCDETPKKKAGPPIEGLARYRNGAGAARQESRTRRGVNCGLGILHMPLTRWPGHCLSIPVGCERYLTAPPAHHLNVPYRSRSQLARDIREGRVQQVPGRSLYTLADGGYAPKEYLRQLPTAAQAVGRCPISAKLYALPPPPPPTRRGARRNKGAGRGAPKTLAQTAQGWAPPPSAAGAEIHDWGGLGHPVWPGRRLRVVVVRRPAHGRPPRAGRRTSPPPVAAFFTTDRSLSPEDL